MALLSDRRRQIDTLFQEALQLEASDRLRFLESKCGDDVALREELETRLAAAENSRLHTSRPSQSGDSATSVPSRRRRR